MENTAINNPNRLFINEVGTTNSVRQLRKALMLSQQSFGEKLGYTIGKTAQVKVSQFESGLYVPSNLRDKMSQLARTEGISWTLEEGVST